MADRVQRCSMNTPGFPQAEASDKGVDITCSTLIGGLTPKTRATMLLPAGKTGNVHHTSNAFTVDPTTNFSWNFGFYVWFSKVDLAATGKPDIVLKKFIRGGVVDFQLELRSDADASGHALHIVDSTGTSKASMVNVFSDQTGVWVEGYFLPRNSGAASVKVGGLLRFNAIGDFLNAATSNTSMTIEFEGQVDNGTLDSNNTATRIGPTYLWDNANTTFDWLGPNVYECFTHRINATNTDPGCDESDVDGAGENSTGNWSNSSDDTGSAVQFASHSSNIIGASKACDVVSDDGPAPYFAPGDTDWYGQSFVFVTNNQSLGTYKLSYGQHNLGTTAWDTTLISVGAGLKGTQVLGVGGVGSFPLIPTSSAVAVMGIFAYAPVASKRAKILECYHFAFGKQGMGEEDWPDDLILKNRKRMWKR